MAQLPDDAFDRDAFPSGNVRGAIQAVSMPNGQGVMFHVNFSGLPDSGGPFREYPRHLPPKKKTSL